MPCMSPTSVRLHKTRQLIAHPIGNASFHRWIQRNLPPAAGPANATPYVGGGNCTYKIGFHKGLPWFLKWNRPESGLLVAAYLSPYSKANHDYFIFSRNACD